MSTAVSLATVTDATFATEVGPGSGLVAVDFSAEWCTPCRFMTPIVEAVAQEYAPQLRALQIDADANPATTVRFGVRGLPTLLVFRDGEVVDRIIGAVSKAVLMERLARVMAE